MIRPDSMDLGVGVIMDRSGTGVVLRACGCSVYEVQTSFSQIVTGSNHDLTKTCDQPDRSFLRDHTTIPTWKSSQQPSNVRLLNRLDPR